MTLGWNEARDGPPTEDGDYLLQLDRPFEHVVHAVLRCPGGRDPKMAVQTSDDAQWHEVIRWYGPVPPPPEPPGPMWPKRGDR